MIVFFFSVASFVMFLFAVGSFRAARTYSSFGFRMEGIGFSVCALAILWLGVDESEFAIAGVVIGILLVQWGSVALSSSEFAILTSFKKHALYRRVLGLVEAPTSPLPHVLPPRKHQLHNLLLGFLALGIGGYWLVTGEDYMIGSILAGSGIVALIGCLVHERRVIRNRKGKNS